MEASLTRKESKRHRRKNEGDFEPSTEERLKEKRQRKRKDGKRKKKRSTVPDLDDGQTLGKDNIGLEDEENLESGINLDKNIEPDARIDESKDVESREMGSQERLSSSQTSVSREGIDQGLVDPVATGMSTDQGQDTHVPSQGNGILPQTDQVSSMESGTKSEQGLRRRATLTEMGQSFDEDQASGHNEVSY